METSTEKKGYGKRPMWQWVAIYIVLAVVVYGLVYAYSRARGNRYGAAPTPTPLVEKVTTTPSPTPVAPTPANGTLQTVSPTPAAAEQIAVNATEYAFSPPDFTVPVGQPVKLIFSNNGTMPHNFVISDLGIRTNTLQPGERQTLTFTPVKTGSFGYICTIPGHAARGMRGTMIVQ